MKKRLVSLLMAMAMTLALCACGADKQQDATQGQGETSGEAAYPTKGISLIVPYSAGGGTDSLMRLVASYMEKELGQSVIVTNVAGGGGQVGMTQLANSAPDGYTIGAVTDVDHYITLTTGENVEYTKDSFRYIGSINTGWDVIMASKDSGFQTLDDLVNYAKENPGKLTVGVSGAFHLLDAGKLSQSAGIEFTTIMHDGAGDSFSACLGGQVDALIIDKKYVAQAEGQDITVLASFGSETTEGLEDVPLAKDLGYDFSSTSTRLICAPAGTPDEVVAALESALEKIAQDPEFMQAMTEMTEICKFVGSEELTKQVDDGCATIQAMLEETTDLLG